MVYFIQITVNIELKGDQMQVGERIYCDYQATTPLDDRVKDAILYGLATWGNPHSSDHIWGWESAKSLEAATVKIAECLGLQSSEIIFTSGATEANNLGILGFAKGALNKKNKRIAVASLEHKAVLEAAFELRDNEGWLLDVIEVDENGYIVESSLKESLLNGSCLVSIMAVNNEIGTIQHVRKISSLCHEFGAYFHCDAVQAFGNRLALFEALKFADAVSVTGHKVYGPKGVGALIIKKEWVDSIRPMMFGGAQQGGLRPGTMPVHQIIGFAEAVKIWSEESEKDLPRIESLSKLFITQLTERGLDFKLNGPEFPQRHCGNVNIQFSGINNHELLGMLQPKVAASTGSACNSGIPGASHVLSAIGLSRDQANSSVRFSFGRFSDEQQVMSVVEQICNCIDLLF